MPRPDLAIVGNLTWDLTPDGRQLGGTACYAAAVAARLGVRTALVTHAGAEIDPAVLLPGVDVHRIDATATAVFEHRYEGGRRIQYVRQPTVSIGPECIPEALRDAPAVLLGPLLNDVEPAVARAFTSAVAGAAVQGWLRDLSGDGRVEEGAVTALDLAALAGRLSVAVLSEEDLAGAEVPRDWLAAVPIIIVTRGSRGLRLHWSGRWWRLAAFPAREQDATGAGDALATAFLLEYARTGDVAAAARFAAAVASFVVEAPGPNGAPARAAVEHRLETYPDIRLTPEA